MLPVNYCSMAHAFMSDSMYVSDLDGRLFFRLDLNVTHVRHNGHPFTRVVLNKGWLQLSHNLWEATTFLLQPADPFLKI